MKQQTTSNPRGKLITFAAHLKPPMARKTDARIQRLEKELGISVTRASYLVRLINQDLASK